MLSYSCLKLILILYIYKVKLWIRSVFNTLSCSILTEMFLHHFPRMKTAADRYIWLIKTTPRVPAVEYRRTATFPKNEIPPRRRRLIDADASDFSALQRHRMKIRELGEQINSELCHAGFVDRYIRSLFIPAQLVPQTPCKANSLTKIATAKGNQKRKQEIIKQASEGIRNDLNKVVKFVMVLLSLWMSA